MRHNVQILIDIIILRFQKKISSIDRKFVQNAIFKLIYLKKANLVYYKGIKKNINILHKNATAKFKQSKSETESAEEVRPVIKFIPISTSEFNIPANLNNAVIWN